MNDMSPPVQPQQSSMRYGILVIAILGVLALSVVAYEQLGSTADAPAETATTESSATSSPVVTTTTQETTVASFADGEYTQVGRYTSPAGPEEIVLSIILQDGIITDSSLETRATNPASINFQGQFKGGYKQLIVGKSIDEVELDVVAGSSLTPKGFQEALEKIKQEAATT